MVTFRRFTIGQRNNMCFHISCYLRRDRRSSPLLSLHRSFQTVGGIRGSDILNRGWRSVVRRWISATVIYFALLRSEASNMLARSMALADDVPLPTRSVRTFRSASLSSMMCFTDGIGYTSHSLDGYIIP